MNTKSQSRKRSHAESVSMSPTSYHHQNATISSDYIDYDNSSPKSGKWTPEEEQFANKLIQDFELGLLLDCENGCTLRSYLARKLNCAPMRISKKFAGQCIGKHVFTRRPENDRMIVRDDFNHPPAKFLKLTMQDMPGGMMHFNTNYDITRDASFFRRDSNTSDITADSTDSISCTTNEFEEISDNSEAAEWRDVLSFFCGEFNLDNEDTAIYRSNNNNNPSNHSNNLQNNNNNNDLLLFNFQEDWNA